ncbi:MAG: class I SAM-dependent methyltransferase family protein, partial [Candidatus Bathyarchaeia archaeon]
MRRDLRAKLRGVLPEEKQRLVPRSFDIIGSKGKAVAIIEIGEELRPFERQIAAALMEVHGNVASVLARESGRAGEFRLRELRLVAGDP